PPPVVIPHAPVAPSPPPPPPKPSEATPAKLRGDPSFGIGDDDYPPSAIRNNEQGVTGAAWDIDATGRVQNCRITSSSGFADLDQLTCTLITRRARYSPAKDAAGNAIPSQSARSIRWTIPKD
ncbi:energy transducer TonB, partial [Nostoc sp. 3335mG]